MQVVDQAKDGQVGPQWAYADYLRINNKQAAAEEWYQTAMKNSKTGKDLWGHFIGRCDKTNLFNHKAIEAKLKAVAKTSPDTNLLLLDFYLLLDCGAFDLAKATETLPKLTQCAHLALGEYIRMADRMKYPIKEKAFIDIKNNIELCHNELKNGPADDSLVKEFIPLRQESLDELERMVAKTITN